MNLSLFSVDKESLAPLVESLNEPKCKLKFVKFSLGSISDLDVTSCNILGTQFQQHNVSSYFVFYIFWK